MSAASADALLRTPTEYANDARLKNMRGLIDEWIHLSPDA